MASGMDKVEKPREYLAHLQGAIATGNAGSNVAYFEAASDAIAISIALALADKTSTELVSVGPVLWTTRVRPA